MTCRNYLAFTFFTSFFFGFCGCDSNSDRSANKDRIKKELMGETPSPETPKPPSLSVEKPTPNTADPGPELDLSKLTDVSDSQSSSESSNTNTAKSITKPEQNTVTISSIPRADDPSQPWIQQSQLPRVIWDGQQMGTASVGYERRMTTRDDRSNPDKDIVKNEFVSRTRVSLKGKSQIQTLNLVTFEKMNGELLEYRGTLDIGGEKRSFSGLNIRDNGSFRIELEEKGNTTTTRIEWNENFRGPFAVEQSMLRRPMQLGEIRLIKYLDPVSAKLIESRLVAESEEMIPLKEKDTRELLRIRNFGKSGDLDRVTVLWADKQGNAFRSYFLPADIVWLRLDEDKARIVESSIDIFFLPRETTLKVENNRMAADTLTEPQKYVLTHKFKSLKGAFPQTCNQYAFPVLDNILAVMVVPVDSRSTLPREVEIENDPSPETLKESNFIEIQESFVQDLAKYYLKQDRTPDAVIGKCAKELHKRIELKPFDGQLQSIRTTHRNKSANCVEHALLLASVGRAAKIPCRVALGAKYNHQAENPKMVLHAWVEYHDGQRWIPADSSDDKFPVTTDRIKFRDTDFNSTNPMREIVEVCRQLAELEIVVSNP